MLKHWEPKTVVCATRVEPEGIYPPGKEKILKPFGIEFYEFKKKEFDVKLRIVGNSYAVSIPMEIVNFMKEQEKMMDDMVRLSFEEFGKISLNFANNLHNNSGIINDHKISSVKVTDLSKDK